MGDGACRDIREEMGARGSASKAFPDATSGVATGVETSHVDQTSSRVVERHTWQGIEPLSSGSIAGIVGSSGALGRDAVSHRSAVGHSSKQPVAPPSEAIAACTRVVRDKLSAGCLVVLACEASLEGVLTAVGITYLAHVRDGEVRLARDDNVQLQIGEQLVRVPHVKSDEDVAFARRVLHGFSQKITSGCRRRTKAGTCPKSCSHDCVRRVALACASDDPQMPEIVHRYLRLGFERGPAVRGLIAHPQVAALDALARTVVGECEHTRQFVRFSHMSDDSYIASFRPKANTVPLVARHFAARMGPERFCLVDPVHRIAAFHEAGARDCAIVQLDGALARSIAERDDLADDEAYVRAMWQRFYQRTALPGRDASQRGYDLRTSWMPQRFWSGLTELGPELVQHDVPLTPAPALP